MNLISNVTEVIQAFARNPESIPRDVMRSMFPIQHRVDIVLNGYVQMAQDEAGWQFFDSLLFMGYGNSATLMQHTMALNSVYLGKMIEQPTVDWYENFGVDVQDHLNRWYEEEPLTNGVLLDAHEDIVRSYLQISLNYDPSQPKN